VRVLGGGGLVAFPTETVYGSRGRNQRRGGGADLCRERPSALQSADSHVADLDAAQRIARFDADAEKLARAFWPGPLTLVLPKASACPVSELATAGLDTIAVRVAGSPVAQDILRSFGKPVSPPSANQSGMCRRPPRPHVRADLDGRIDLIWTADRRASAWSRPSCLVWVRRHCCVPVEYPRERIERVLGTRWQRRRRWRTKRRSRPACSPRTMRDDAAAIECRGGSIPVKPCLRSRRQSGERGARSQPFGVRRSREAAANLFSHLRTLDAAGHKGMRRHADSERRPRRSHQ